MDHIPPFTQQEVLQYESLPSAEQFKKVLLQRSKSSSTLAELTFRLYSCATDLEWDVTKKCGLLNLALKALADLIKSHSKQDFVDLLRKQSQLAGRRDGNYKRLFDEAEIHRVQSVLRGNLLPYYELYRITFDRHFHFRLETSKNELVKQLSEGELPAGTPVEVETVAVLQEFVGIRQPKQQKKDVKKK